MNGKRKRRLDIPSLGIEDRLNEGFDGEGVGLRRLTRGRLVLDPKSGCHAPQTSDYRGADDNYQLIRAETFYESSLPTSSAGQWALVILYSEAAAEPVVWRFAIESVVTDPLDVVGIAPRLQTFLANVHLTATTVILRRLDRAHSHVAFFPDLSFCDANPSI